MDDESKPPKLTRPQRVAKALLWADSLDDNQLVDRAKTRAFPPEAIVGLVRRFRLEGKQQLSNLLAEVVYNRALMFVSKQFDGVPESFREQISTDAVSAFIRSLVQQDKIDFWEINFFEQLKNKANNSYQKIRKRYENELYSEDLAGQSHDAMEFSAEGLKEQIQSVESFKDEALIKAISRKVLSDDELKLLFTILSHKGVPISSKKATTDLVRITGFARTKIFELRDSIVSKLNPIKEKVVNYD